MNFATQWPGVFLVFEGIDGAGKSTQIQRLGAHLRAAGEEPVLSREPTDGPWGRRIRESATTGRMTANEELQAFIHDRTEHLEMLVMPALQAGRVVVLDRYFYSTIAYQGTRPGGDPAAVRRQMESLFPAPDLVLWFDLEPERALVRITASRGEIPNEFERQEGLERAREVFQTMAGGHIRRIDASGSEDEIFSHVRTEVLRAIRIKRPELAARLNP
ncbi:MAG: dTMP kinase [Acidobacteriota bacterium]